MLDLRLPIGAMFSVLGAILLYGASGPLAGWTGLAMLSFGGGALTLAYTARRADRRH